MYYLMSLPEPFSVDASPKVRDAVRRAHTEKLRRQRVKEAAERGDAEALAKRAAELERIAKRFPGGFEKRTAAQDRERSVRRRARTADKANHYFAPAFKKAAHKDNV